MKRLVICCDGTWGTPESDIPSNVVKATRAVLPSDNGTPQIVFYDWGIGTDVGQRLWGGALGKGIDKNICDAYRFLSHNYEPGDEIYLFGFSRGAYTVRSLVGLLSHCGLLPKNLEHKIPEAYSLYRERISESGLKVQAFRVQTWTVKVTFLGVWDTVGSLGIPGRLSRWILGAKYQFHDTRLSPIVETACHALAADETRKSFTPTLWVTEEGRQGTEQCWFPGQHSDVGGGTENIELSNYTFTYVMNCAQRKGLALDTDYMNSHPCSLTIKVKQKWSILALVGRGKRTIGKTNCDEVISFLSNVR